MEPIKPIPVLYILIRNDLDSMNPGKAAAQASHAASAFALNSANDDSPEYQRWVNETSQGFGTVLTLAVTENQMIAAVNIAGACGFATTIIHDPTYPLVDGDIIHYIPLDTCAYVFVGDKDDPIACGILGNFPLHP